MKEDMELYIICNIYMFYSVNNSTVSISNDSKLGSICGYSYGGAGVHRQRLTLKKNDVLRIRNNNEDASGFFVIISPKPLT